jgi:carbamoyl-phosphate synthase small subunit
MHLHLDDGSSFRGEPFGSRRSVRGEVVFNTGMTGYVETLTDPSYRGQILVLTYPLQGNYGVPNGPFESSRIQVQGLVVQRHADVYSHHSGTRSLDAWLQAQDVPALAGVDTRALTRMLREGGTMPGTLDLDDRGSPAAVEMKRVAEQVVGDDVVRYDAGDLRVLLVDTGAKESIVDALRARGVGVVRAPFLAQWERLLGEVDGVVLTNGPGDPADVPDLVARLRPLLAMKLPVFGICLGHQLLALAAGAETYKLKYGHRSQNQPVVDLAGRRAYVTSQNHGYAVRSESLPRDWEPWFLNLNDGTNEGIRHQFRPIRSVQFHPEAAAGPHDTAWLFDDFVHVLGEMRTIRAT